MKEKITKSADKVKRKRKLFKRVKLALLIFVLLLLAIYFVISIIYNNGNFSITLDDNLYFEKAVIIYDNPEYKIYRSELVAEIPETFDNISYKWLPEDIDNYEGSHNGDNYLAYSFYVENIGESVSDYWTEIIIDDVIKNVDEAARIRVYKDGEYVTYAKASRNGDPEENTVAFATDELVARDHVENLGPGDRVKYTVVMWIEGSDPDCTDNILGGEIKVHMAFNSEFVEEEEGEN